jgi:adenine-specific DNA-methyltransferase
VTRTAERRKALGAFYTPPDMARKLVEWSLRAPTDTVLDPSFGGLVFLKAARERLLELGADPSSVGSQIYGVDLDQVAVRTAIAEASLADCQLIQADFFHVKPSQELTFTANLGNPPYVRYQAWNGSAKKAHSIAKDMGVPLTRLSSTWAPFILHGCRFLERGGRMGQVLPAEFLHSQYARPVADFLVSSFESVTIVLFETKVFPTALEEVLLLFADGYGFGPARGIGVVTARDLSELTLEKIDGKGRGYLDRDLPLLRLLPKRTQSLYRLLARDPQVRVLGDFASVDIGIVTGANDFFLRARAEVEERGFDGSLFKIGIAKATDLEGARFSATDVDALESRGRRTALLDARRASEEALGTVEELVREGEKRKLHERYKCRIRSPWFALPISRRGPPDAFLTYMNNAFPRLVLNEARALSTNTIHNVSMVNGGSAAALSVAFYNSLTLLSAELVGRSYGGGILKLEPTEAERLLIPPTSEGLKDALPAVDEALRARDLDAVLDLVDPLVLYPLGLSRAQVAGLRRAREKLSSRRRTRTSKIHAAAAEDASAGHRGTRTTRRRAQAGRKQEDR